MCPDSDEAGAKSAWGVWLAEYQNAVRYPCIGGKDPGEMFVRGEVDIRAWVSGATQKIEYAKTGKNKHSTDARLADRTGANRTYVANRDKSPERFEQMRAGEKTISRKSHTQSLSECRVQI